MTLALLKHFFSKEGVWASDKLEALKFISSFSSKAAGREAANCKDMNSNL
jgi:hypothetical protein